jgi:hypothetical protein
MRRVSVLLLFVAGVVFVAGPRAAAAQQTPAGASGGLTGRWAVKADFYGTPLYFQLELKDEESSRGSLGGRSWMGASRETRCILWRKTKMGWRNARQRSKMA